MQSGQLKLAIYIAGKAAIVYITLKRKRLAPPQGEIFIQRAETARIWLSTFLLMNLASK